jgi:serine O-acetyltransferase
MTPSIFSLLVADIRAKAEWVYGSASAKNLLKTLLTDGTFAMICYRKMQWSRRWKLAPLAMFFNKMNGFFGRCVIGRGAQFGPGFVIVHSYGVVINTAVRGGANITIEHGVTIGAEKGQSPVLGDHVFIGAGAKILGGIRVGNNVKIGANAVVVHDVPDNCTAMGVPATIKNT